jgi:hypothetical protein
VIHREELSVEDEALLFDNEATPVVEPIVQAPVIPNRQLTLEEVIEMAELEAEAAQFDPPSVSSDEDWENDEQDEDEEEMQRHEEAAHTGSVYLPSDSFSNQNIIVSHTTAVFTGISITTTGSTWQSVIELVDDTE